MKALAYQKFGGPDVLELIDIPEPVIATDELLVQVKNVSLNPIEWKFRKGEMKLMSGSRFPQFVGGEFSGVVQQTGPAVTGFAPGDEVFGFINAKRGGAIQEKIAVKPHLIARKPENIPFETAASLSVVGIAAMTGLFKTTSIKAGQRILITGCTGNMGMWAVQIAKDAGLYVTGVCSTYGVETARKLGCDRVIDYKKEEVSDLKETFDIVFDTASSLTFDGIKPMLNKNGVFLNPTPTPAQILGSLIGNLFSGKKHKVILGAPNQVFLNELAGYVSRKNFYVPVHKVFPLQEFRPAYMMAEKGGFIGKIVLQIS